VATVFSTIVPPAGCADDVDAGVLVAGGVVAGGVVSPDVVDAVQAASRTAATQIDERGRLMSAAS